MKNTSKEIDLFIEKIIELKKSAESKKLPYGEKGDNHEDFRFNEFHALDRNVVRDCVKKILNAKDSNLTKKLIERETTYAFENHLEFIDFLAMIVILASKELKVSRYAIMQATEDLIIGNY